MALWRGSVCPREFSQKGAPTISMAQMRSCGVKILKVLAKVREKKSERGRSDGSVVC